MPHPRRLTRAGWLSLGLVALALLIGLGVMRDFGLDDSYITYRYARNAARGWGLVYNPGENVLSTTAPLYALLLAALSRLLPLGLPTLGGLVGALSIGLGGGLLAGLLPRRIAFPVRAWAGLAYLLASPLWLALGMETALWLLLVLAAAWLMRASRWGGAGLLVGLAVLTRPDAVLPGALLGLGAVGTAVSRRGTCTHPWRGLWRFALAAALPVAGFYGWAWLTYGSPLPATFAAKRAQAALGITGLGIGVDTLGGLGLIAASLWRQSPLYGLALALAALGLARWRRLPAAAIGAAAWGILHLLAYAILDVAPYRWYYAPLLPGLILLAALGLDTIDRAAARVAGGRWLTVGAAALVLAAGATSLAAVYGRMTVDGTLTPADADPMLPVVDWSVYREAGEWIARHTPPDALIGVAEVGQMGFYADRPMSDYLGLLQPQVAGWLARGDVTSWLPATAPDYLVLQRFRGRPLVIYNYYLEPDPWFQFNYAPVAEFDDPRYAYGPVTIYERVTAIRPAADFSPGYPRTLGFDFGPLTLDGFALDWRGLDPAQRAIRVGLAWSLSGDEPLPDQVRIAVSVTDLDGVVGSDLTYDTALWDGVAFTTWHGLILPADMPPGGQTLLVTVRPAAGDPYASRPVAPLDFSFPTAAAPDDAPTFSDDDAALLRLADRAITLADDDTITLDLTWGAARDVPRAYTCFLHLRPDGEAAPARQADGQPRTDGYYPTDWWQAGEAVPDTITLDAADLLPGDYALVIGWYVAPDGPRLTLADGADALLLARLTVDATGEITIEPER